MLLLMCLFWFFVLAAGYSYFLYPFLLGLLVRLRAQPNVQADILADAPSLAPETLSMTLIITAFNEQDRIAKKIENSLALRASTPDLEIIVASDCSEDATDAIVKGYEHVGVRLIRAEQRLGKENAQLCAIQIARGDILVFSDVATQIPEDALLHLGKYFLNPSIGAVSSEDHFISQDGAIAGEGAYVRYEMWLRNLESQLSGLIGLSGSFFAARKSVCQAWDIHCPSDFNTALNSASLGLRAVSAPDVQGFYEDLKDSSKEYQRKLRTVIRGITGLARHKQVMNPAVFGAFAFQVISHKLMRWLAPWFFIAVFLLNALIALEGIFYGLVFLGQLLFYGMALVAHFVPVARRVPLIKIVYFFVQVNVAMLDGTIKFLSGTRMTTWKPSAR